MLNLHFVCTVEWDCDFNRVRYVYIFFERNFYVDKLLLCQTVAHFHNLSTWDVKAGELLRV